MAQKRSNRQPVWTFDHSAIAELAEYAAASKAIDDLAHTVRAAGTKTNHVEWLEAVKEMAAALPYGDMCQACWDRRATTSEDTDASPSLPPTPAPLAADVDGDSLRGRYVCPTCGFHWQCSYSVKFPHML